jgi:hypothetical protein
MKTTLRQRPTALTRTDVIVVVAIFVLLYLGVDSMTATHGSKLRAQRISCVNNLKQIGTAYRLWADDHAGKTPASESLSDGGWSDLLTNGEQGANCWTNYAILADALGRSPKLVMCPSDDRVPATDFGTNAVPNDPYRYHFQNNSNLAYFVGVSANTKSPRSLLAGDRNLGGGTVPDSDYGLSPGSGKGNDAAIPITGPVSWSLKMHSDGKPAGVGNILMGDGSVQQVSSADFNKTWLRNAPPTTNWPAGHIPAAPSIRLVFP